MKRDPELDAILVELALREDRRTAERPGECEETEERAPCDDCRFRERCDAEQLACERYAMYSSGLPQWRWQNAPTAPTRGRFLALFGEAR
jgi:hypothetical protein